MNDGQDILRLPENLIGEGLESLYRKYNDKKYIQYDPIKYVYRFHDPVEQELVGLIASTLAFGRVSQIFKAVDRLLEIVRNEPLRYILAHEKRPGKELLAFRYRFVTGLDLYQFFSAARKILMQYGSLGNFMRKNYETGAFLKLVERVIRAFQGIHYLIPSSLKGSPCKRLFMYFRWMARADNIDMGLWDFIHSRELVIPLDTHIFRVSGQLGFTNRKTPSLATAVKITDCLRKYCEDDPVKYDWALAHQGILANNFRIAPALS